MVYYNMYMRIGTDQENSFVLFEIHGHIFALI